MRQFRPSHVFDASCTRPWRTLKRVASTCIQHPVTISVAHIFNDAPADVFTPLIFPKNVARFGTWSSIAAADACNVADSNLSLELDVSFEMSEPLVKPVDDVGDNISWVTIARGRDAAREDTRGSGFRNHSSHTYVTLVNRTTKYHIDTLPNRTSTIM